MKLEPTATTNAGRRRLVTWLWRLPVVAVLGGLAFGLREAYRIQFGRARPNPNQSFASHPAQEVAPLSTFTEPWSAVEFTYADQPAIALHLPAAISGGLSAEGIHLAAFSRICTHLGCPISLKRDVEAIAFAFNFRGRHPALVCPCHLSVFAPLEAGRVVSGPAIEPLPRIKLTLQDGIVYASGLET